MWYNYELADSSHLEEARLAWAQAATMYENGDIKLMIASVKLAVHIVEISFRPRLDSQNL